jgi:L-amino acid N-acyltransferase YncA
MEELAGLDHRTPVPLQPMMAWHQKQNMMEHLVAIQRITAGLAREDWEEVASASGLIESSPQMQQMCQHMGAGAQGFTEMALDFHRRADAIGVAARAHDGAAVLRATSNTLQSCIGCHAAFRQVVVSATEWQRRTGQAHDPTQMHGEH